MSKKYNFVYITTNLITNKQYIGAHSTNNLNDNYLGSGQILKSSIKKNGRKNFKREILKIYSTAEEAHEKELYWINEKNTLIPNGYNILENGGNFGSYDEFTKSLVSAWKKRSSMSEETKRKIGKSRKGKIPWNKNKKTGKRDKNTKEKIRRSLIGTKHSEKRKANISKGLIGKSIGNKGRKLSEEHKNNLKKAWERRKLKNKENGDPKLENFSN